MVQVWRCCFDYSYDLLYLRVYEPANYLPGLCSSFSWVPGTHHPHQNGPLVLLYLYKYMAIYVWAGPTVGFREDVCRQLSCQLYGFYLLVHRWRWQGFLSSYRKLETHMPTASTDSKRNRQGRPVDGSCHDHTEGLSDWTVILCRHEQGRCVCVYMDLAHAKDKNPKPREEIGHKHILLSDYCTMNHHANSRMWKPFKYC